MKKMEVEFGNDNEQMYSPAAHTFTLPFPNLTSTSTHLPPFHAHHTIFGLDWEFQLLEIRLNNYDSFLPGSDVCADPGIPLPSHETKIYEPVASAGCGP